MLLTELRSMLEEIRQKVSRGIEILHIAEKKQEIEEMKKEAEKPDFWNDPETARTISQKISVLEKLVHRWEGLRGDSGALLEMSEMITEDSPEFSEITAEFQKLNKNFKEAEMDLLFGGEFDDANALLEINAGAGGTEAQDWAGMLLRMYLRFCERHEFRAEILEKTEGMEAGIKSCTIEISGERALGLLRSEKGTHRLVRQSPFNAKNLRQTSFAGVIVTPIFEKLDTEIVIDDKDLRVETFRASGAGGQHVNKTDSAVRMVHLPTGIVAECQNQRSQHQNREKALEILKSKLLVRQKEEEEKKAAEIRGEVTEAAWGTQIRNYVLHPYKMVKDTRTECETSQTESVLDGGIDDFIRAYLEWDAKKKGEHN